MNMDKTGENVPGSGFTLARGPEASANFNVLDHAEHVINEAWSAEIPPFYPDPSGPHGFPFRDSVQVTNSLKALAELVYFSKQRARAIDAMDIGWIQGSFARTRDSDYLPSLRLLINAHFPELALGGEPTDVTGRSGRLSSRRWLPSRHSGGHNYFYLQDFKDIPEIPELDDLLESCGVSHPDRPESRDYLIQAYHRTQVRLDRLIALSHLLIAGAQSDLKVNRSALERELVLQEKLKELKASYLVEHATMELAFAKRLHGPHMLDRLNSVSGFPRKHRLALEAIENRLSVGTEQFPSIINSTLRVQRVFQSLGQLLLGGFLASEVIKSVSEWSAVYAHRDHVAFFSELALQLPGVSVEGIEALSHEYHTYELSSVTMSITVVCAVVGIALYYRLRNRTIKHALPASGGHHH